MEAYSYKVGGLYHDETLAQEALEKLCARGFPETQLRLITPGVPRKNPKRKYRGTEAAEMIEDTLISLGANSLVDAASSAAQLVDMALFVTTPVLAALLVAGNKAAIGDVREITGGSDLEETALLNEAQEVLHSGAWTVLVYARNRDEEACACMILAETADAYTLYA